jgi:hypothetical protein
VDEVGAVEFVDGLEVIGSGLPEVADEVDHAGGCADREVPGGLAAGVAECVDCGRWGEDGGARGGRGPGVAGQVLDFAV